MIWAVNYANEKFAKAQKLNTKTAYAHGVDKVLSFAPEDIDIEFREKNKDILSRPRGNGYWLWKPYFIAKAMELMEDGEWLIYADAGLYYLSDVKAFIRKATEQGAWLICQETGFPEKQYTKRDAFVYMNMDAPVYIDAIQRAATLVIIKKCKKSYEFLQEWIKYASDSQIITDDPNTCGKENYEGFIENRHDQSVFSLLTKKYEGVTIDNNLFVKYPRKEKPQALLCCHRTNHGSVMSVRIHRKADPYWWKLKAIIKKGIGKISNHV